MLGAAALLGTASCMDGDWDAPDLSTPPYGNNSLTPSNVITIAELKAKYASDIANNAAKLVTEDIQLLGIVSGNDVGGNIYKQIALQDATGSIIVGINASGLYTNLTYGQEILINLKGLYVGGYGKQAQVGGLYNGGLGRMENSTWQQHVRLMRSPMPALVDTIDFAVAKTDIDKYCGALVKLSNVEFDEADGKVILAHEDEVINSNCVHHTFKGMKSSEVVLRTSTYSDFAGVVLPEGKVDVVGIATRYRDTWQIYLRTESDLTLK